VTEHAFVRAVRDFYTRLPHTSGRFSRSDRQLALALFQRHIPFDTVRSAMLLAIAHRLYRQGPPLPTIRSLHYFAPVIDEILRQPLPPGYVQYLEYKIAAFK
jgi:hypothetical protein